MSAVMERILNTCSETFRPRRAHLRNFKYRNLKSKAAISWPPELECGLRNPNVEFQAQPSGNDGCQWRCPLSPLRLFNCTLRRVTLTTGSGMAFRKASPHSPVLCLPASLLSLPLALRGRPRAASRGLALGPGSLPRTVCTARCGERVRCTWFA